MDNVAQKIVVISPQIKAQTGGGVINGRNIELLHGLGAQFTVFQVDALDKKANAGLVGKIGERLRGIFGGLSDQYLQEIKQLLLDTNPDVVWINQSLMGAAAKLVKDTVPNARVVTFFHNIEVLYFRDLLRTNPLRLSNYFNRISARLAERLSVRYSDYLVAMNPRDNQALLNIYHRSADLILPTSLSDKGAVIYQASAEGAPLELLFVGFNFFANLHGITWFCNQVMPLVPNARLTIVGREMERERQKLNSHNVDVVGSVDDLKAYYQRADMVVSPIFVGSGMKTKTAEAMMFGVPLLASTEALEGYDIDPEKIGHLCQTKEEFVAQINRFASHKALLPPLAQQARCYFEEQYDQKEMQNEINRFFEHIR